MAAPEITDAIATSNLKPVNSGNSTPVLEATNFQYSKVIIPTAILIPMPIKPDNVACNDQVSSSPASINTPKKRKNIADINAPAPKPMSINIVVSISSRLSCFIPTHYVCMDTRKVDCHPYLFAGIAKHLYTRTDRQPTVYELSPCLVYICLIWRFNEYEALF